MKVTLLLCTPVLLALSGCATQARQPQVFTYFRNLPIGTPITKIEADLSLKDPEKTFAGNSLYHHRSFGYRTANGLFLHIGLKQMTDDDSYQTGTFLYRGHHTVGMNGWVWKRWEYEDGYIDMTWDPNGHKAGVNRLHDENQNVGT